MLRCIEQKVCNISYMSPNQKIKFNDWYMKIEPPMWIATDFECMNLPVNKNNNNNDDDHNNNGVTDKLFINKPLAKGYNIFKNLDYDNLNLEKEGYIKHFGEDCVEWFIKEMLEIESYMKTYFKNELEINVDTFPKNFDESTCWLREKEFKTIDVIEKSNCYRPLPFIRQI